MKNTILYSVQHLKPIFSWLSVGLFASAVGGSIAPPAKAQNYSDIQGHWAQQCIQGLTQQGVVSGYPDQTFRPDNVITRAEYAAMIDQAFPNTSLERNAINFKDVSASYWGQDAIQNTYRKGFLSGYPGQVFKPNDLIQRVEAFVALASGLDYESPASPESLLNATYTDAQEIPEYAEGKIAAATKKEILISPPKPNVRLMGPTDPATRAQVAAALCQVKNVSGVPNRYVVNAQQPEDNSPIALSQTCTNEAVGYTVNYPQGWVTNSGSVVEQCKVFDPESISLPEQSESFDEAVHIRVDRVPFERVASTDNQSSQELSRRQTTIDGYQAVVVENKATGIGLIPEGVRSYLYFVDLDGQTLIGTTYDMQGQRYQRNKQVLDQMMNSLSFNR
ncbi:MAG: S-layer homology domain-containing protein [Coleofasciculus sp. C1-SOL-03]|uniref:S-layer homology domain-containing protein n=1 Tax=Coleofasciculus sp. C1-SOL-03 TaxID=3069522 RepID=UPI0032F62226